MQSMIERVARALHALRFGPDGWMGEDEPYRSDFEELARAAIEAMREPTPRMVSDMQDTIWFISDEWFPADGAKTVWSDGIDAALAP